MDLFKTLLYRYKLQRGNMRRTVSLLDIHDRVFIPFAHNDPGVFNTGSGEVVFCLLNIADSVRSVMLSRGAFLQYQRHIVPWGVQGNYAHYHGRDNFSIIAARPSIYLSAATG